MELANRTSQMIQHRNLDNAVSRNNTGSCPLCDAGIPVRKLHVGCDRHFKCPSCGEVSTQNEWDNKTLGICINRDQRRKFVSIGTKGKGRKWYECPKCSVHSYNTTIAEVNL